MATVNSPLINRKLEYIKCYKDKLGKILSTIPLRVLMERKRRKGTVNGGGCLFLVNNEMDYKYISVRSDR